MEWADNVLKGFAKMSNDFGKFVRWLWKINWFRGLVFLGIIVALFFGAYHFLRWLGFRENQARQDKSTAFAELCLRVNGGVPVEKVFLGVNPQYFCRAADGRLARVLFQSQNLYDWVGGSAKDKDGQLKDWSEHGQEACAKAGLKNPTYLSQLGFFCEAENGELLPVFHPDEKFVRMPSSF